MIEVVRAPAHLLVEDMGFVGGRSIGLPRCGAMDISALARGNSLVGNAPGEPGLEWALSGGVLHFSSDVNIAVTGATPHGRVGRTMITSDKRYAVPAGTTLEIDRLSNGRFLYLCISPPIDVPLFSGSRSTYAPAGIGGFNGRRLKSGDRISVRTSPPGAPRDPVPAPSYEQSVLTIVPGPQSDALGGRLLKYLLETEFKISNSCDRTGFRLEGSAAPVAGLADILSEPACEGAIQIPGGGNPIVLMADGPTIGGYNKIAVVVEQDIPVLAQKTTGQAIRFALRPQFSSL